MEANISNIPTEPGYFWAIVCYDHPPWKPTRISKEIVGVHRAPDGHLWYFFQYPRPMHNESVLEWGPKIAEWNKIKIGET